jgi:hypothetical protein
MQRGGKLFYYKISGKKFKKKLPRARGGDEVTTFTVVQPLRQAP